MFRIWILLLGITLLGAILRFLNLSPFTLYPDSFQNLLVAANIKTYGSVTGFLGQNGMFYPDFFMWTRSLFPLLINAVSSFGLTPIIAARSIAFVLGIFAVPMAYLVVKAVGKSQTVGLIASFLLALSYNHAVWSGLLMTEASGVFFMLFFLWQFFATVAKTTGFFNSPNFFTGFLFALAVLARYEYCIVAIPVLLYSLKKSKKPFEYIISVFASASIALLIFGFWLYPMSSLVQVILAQTSYLLAKLLFAVGFILFCSIVYRFSSKRYKENIVRRLPDVISILLGLFFILFLFVLGLNTSYIFGLDVSIFANFLKHDFLLSLFAFIGLIKMLEDKKHQTLAYFVLLSVVLLGFIYYQINPDMERYMTHLIPFLLIPGAFGVLYFFETAFINQTKQMRIFLNGIILLFVVTQIIVTARGLRNLNDPSWYRPSYQEKVAQLTGAHLTGKPLLITSMPEPYFYFLHDDTQSITDSYPFIYIPASQDLRTVVIVEDMGMHDYFPNFTKMIDTKLKNYKYATFWVQEQYHSSNHSIPEMYPVELYKIRLGSLKKVLSK